MRSCILVPSILPTGGIRRWAVLQAIRGTQSVKNLKAVIKPTKSPFAFYQHCAPKIRNSVRVKYFFLPPPPPIYHTPSKL